MVSYGHYNLEVFPYESGQVLLVGQLYMSFYFTPTSRSLSPHETALWKATNALVSKSKDLILLASSEHHLGNI